MIAPPPSAFRLFDNSTVTLSGSLHRNVQGKPATVPACVLVGDAGQPVADGAAPQDDAVQVFIRDDAGLPFTPAQGMTVSTPGRKDCTVSTVNRLPGIWVLTCVSRRA